MNTTRTTTAKAIEKIGNIAAYIFWITSAFAIIGFFIALFVYDTPAAYPVGQALNLVAFAMIGSITVMAACVKILKTRGEY